MPDVPEPASPAATFAEATAFDAARIVSDRLEARAANHVRRAVPGPPLASPPGPIPAVSALGVPAPAPLAGAAAEPDLEGATGGTTEEPASLARSTGPRSSVPMPGPASAPPPGVPAPAGPADGPTTRLPGRLAEPSGSVPLIASGTDMAPAILSPPARDDEMAPPATGDAISAGRPGVPGRLPAAVANLALAGGGPPDRGLTGVAGGRPAAADGGTGLDSLMTSARDATSGASPELAQTNDLLQQILDAIRQQGATASSHLPPGGPPVYADRI